MKISTLLIITKVMQDVFRESELWMAEHELIQFRINDDTKGDYQSFISFVEADQCVEVTVDVKPKVSWEGDESHEVFKARSQSLQYTDILVLAHAAKRAGNRSPRMEENPLPTLFAISMVQREEISELGLCGPLDTATDLSHNMATFASDLSGMEWIPETFENRAGGEYFSSCRPKDSLSPRIVALKAMRYLYLWQPDTPTSPAQVAQMSLQELDTHLRATKQQQAVLAVHLCECLKRGGRRRPLGGWSG